MSPTPRLLLAKLPTEIRLEVYKHLSTPSPISPATNIHLPLPLKKYECKHTTLQLCPVHFGSTGLLALHKYHFQEAREYRAWLLPHGVQLRIGVVFKGRVNTFVPSDWARKVETHLRKLAKRHAWLTRVAGYDIRILWAATDGALKSRRNKRTAGQISGEMVDVLTGLMRGDVRRKRGDVRVTLCLEHSVAVENVFSGTKFGFVGFFGTVNDGVGLRSLVKSVWKLPGWKDGGGVSCLPLGAGLLAKKEETELLVVEEGLVKWIVGGKGQLVVSKTIGVDNALEVVVGDVRQGDGEGVDFVLVELVEECMGQR